MNNKTGRPRNTSGSLYRRRDSRVWWMSYRDHSGKCRQESTGRKEKGEAEKVMRKRLVARDEGLLPSAAPDGGITFNQWADWFLEKRSQPPFRGEKTHLQNLGALKLLRPRFGANRLSDITPEEIESYLMTRLNTGKRVHTKLGLQLRGRLKPATVHQELRILRRILNVAVKKRRLAVNPCSGVEFPVPLAGTTRKPHIAPVSKLWNRTLQRAGLPHFSLYELRHTFATRLSAGGVADHFVTQMLRQGDAAVFKRYSQAKLNMMREALSKLDRQANEHGATFFTALAGQLGPVI